MFYKTQRLCVLDPCAKYASTTWDFSHVHLYYMHNPDAKNWKTQQPCSTHGRRITLAHASPYVSFSPIYRRTVSNELACQAPHKKRTRHFKQKKNPCSHPSLGKSFPFLCLVKKAREKKRRTMCTSKYSLQMLRSQRCLPFCFIQMQRLDRNHFSHLH